MNRKHIVRHKAAVVGFGYFFGLLLSSSLDFFTSFVIAAAFAAISVTAFIAGQRLIFAVIFPVALGLSVYGYYDYSVFSEAEKLDGMEFAVSGKITDVQDVGNDTSRYVVKTKVGEIKSSISFFAADSSAKIGDGVSFNAVLHTFSDNVSFEERSYNRTKGILFEASAVKELAFTSEDKASLVSLTDSLNVYVRDNVTALLPNDYGALICAVSLGDKSQLSDSLSNNILRCGISHFTAVSGLHLTVLVSVILPLVNLIRSKYKRILKFAVLLVIILFLMVFFNLSASVLRSGIMLIIFYGGDLFFRKRSAFNSIGFALLLILAFNPTACRDIGLILSVAGCFGIGVAAPAVNTRFASLPARKLREFISSVICANFFTAPIAGLFFGGVSTVALLTNVLIAPLISVVLIAAVLFTLTGCTVSLFLFVSGLGSKAAVFIINLFADFKYSYLSLDYDFLLPWIVSASVFMLTVHFLSGKLAATVKSGIISLAALVGMITASEILVANYTNIKVFSDGSSAAVIIRQKEACAVIVTNDSKKVRAYVSDYLKNRFYGEASVICLLNSTYNSVPLFLELPSSYYAVPHENREFDINSIFTLRKEADYAEILIDDVTVAVSSAQNSIHADIQVLYGYNPGGEADFGRVIYTDERRMVNGQNETNAFYENTSFYIVEGELRHEA